MIERIYLDNIRTFENFEWRPGPLALLLGDNGSGKTALLDTLRGLQAFLMGDASSHESFGESTLTRWSQRREQVVELDLRDNDALYHYRVVIEHPDDESGASRVRSEELTCDGRRLVELGNGLLRVHRGEGDAPYFQFKTTRSGIGAVEPMKTDRQLIWFKQWVARLWLLRPDPRAMSARLEATGADWLAPDLANFGSWYLRQLGGRPQAIFRAMEALGKVLGGFIELHERDGHLFARFGDEKVSSSFRLDELSDGQRALIALYVLRYVVVGPGRTLLADEPDNYVALREIQPWLSELTELALTRGGPQVWLISHHPEIVNLLGPEYGWRFFRAAVGPTRIERFHPAAGLDAAETIARGWDD